MRVRPGAKTRVMVYLAFLVGAVLWAIGAVYDKPVLFIPWAIGLIAWLLVTIGGLRHWIRPMGNRIPIAYGITSVLAYGVPGAAMYAHYGTDAFVVWVGLVAIGLLGLYYEYTRGA